MRGDAGRYRRRLHQTVSVDRWPALRLLSNSALNRRTCQSKRTIASLNGTGENRQRNGNAFGSSDVKPDQNSAEGTGSWWSRFRRAWRTFLDGARVYAHGTAQLYRNMRTTSKLERRLRERGHEALTYPEHLLLVQTRHDRWRAFLLLSVSLISTALIPVLAEAIPGFKPTTFTTEQDRQTLLRMQGVRYLEAQMVLWRAIVAPDKTATLDESLIFPCVMKIASETVDGALRECTRPELLALSKLFGQPAFPVSLSRSLRRRLARHFHELASLDDALQRDGLLTLTQSQLEDACLMRALPAFNRTNDEMRQDLDRWIRRTRKNTRELFQFIADETLQNGALLGWSAPLLKRACGERA
ncbi:hypothetical protein CCYA_CCYA01G0094 [Cyanidiococcus yangmingshanensis]|nr:hypothetical protein CCYA_CCYA01G0094 [Cyanidiococcus yangmingshanensis]